ncbi:MAG TPA: Gldg family protein [Sphingobium sp.]
MAARSGALIFAVILGSLVGGLAFGGVLTTGQADPAFWYIAQAIAMVALGLCARRFVAGGSPRWPVALCGAAGSLCAIALFCRMSSLQLSGIDMLLLGGISLFALLAGLRMPAVMGLLCLLPVLAIAALPQGIGEGPAAPSARPKPSLAVLTALPLFGYSAVSLGKGAPAIDYLRRAFIVTPVDSLAAETLPRDGRLLIAQPRLLRPTDLVELDRWIRKGGKAVILADPLLVWPMDLPFGDHRRPPVTSLLDPLLSHWGLTLMPASGTAVERRFLSGGTLLPLAGASAFETAGGCALAERGLFALCRIGRGEVRLIADADLLDDRLWLVEPNRAPSNRALSGDTMALLSAWLMDPVSPRIVPPSAAWVRSDGAMIRAMRWALLAGMAWAIMGASLIWRWEKPGRHGKT